MVRWLTIVARPESLVQTPNHRPEKADSDRRRQDVAILFPQTSRCLTGELRLTPEPTVKAERMVDLPPSMFSTNLRCHSARGGRHDVPTMREKCTVHKAQNPNEDDDGGNISSAAVRTAAMPSS